MNPLIRNIIAVVIGWLIGSVINMGLVTMGHGFYPITGVDPNDMEALAAIMPTLTSEFFLFPFLAHALGTLFGALVAGLIAKSNKMRAALIVGLIFLIGGIAVNILIPGPLWFAAADIILAYIPMAWIGGKIAQKLSS